MRVWGGGFARSSEGHWGADVCDVGHADGVGHTNGAGNTKVAGVLTAPVARTVLGIRTASVTRTVLGIRAAPDPRRASLWVGQHKFSMPRGDFR